MITRRSARSAFIWFGFCLAAIAFLFFLLAPVVVAVSWLIFMAGVAASFRFFIKAHINSEKELYSGRIISFAKILGALAAGYLGIVLFLAIARPPFVEAPLSGYTYESSRFFSESFVSNYFIALEIVGVLLLAAIVALAIMGRSETRGEA